jgi:lactoylglutathione lyase
MVLNHINLTVTDAEEAQLFLETHFGMQRAPGVKPSPRFGMLRDEQGMVLTLIQGSPGREIEYPESFHIGFGVPSRDTVNEINARLRAAGYHVEAPSRQHGAWTFYFRAPGGFIIEVLAE